MHRPLLVAIYALSCLLFFKAEFSEAKETAKRPNILLIFSDDHAYQAISAYPGALNKTPNIDRIAKEGMRFDRCYVTNSICGPSRAVVLTGKYSHKNGFLNNRNKFDGTQQTMPKLLKKVGYQTAVIGKWHLKSDPTGFDYWHVLPGQGVYYNPPMRENGKQVKHTGYVTDIITDQTLSWLKEKRDPDKPFLLMCQHKAPHRNWMPAERHLKLYDDKDFPEPETLFDDYKDRASPAANQTMTIARHMTAGSDLKKVFPKEKKKKIKGRRANYWYRLLNSLTPEQRKAFEEAYVPKNKQLEKAGLTGDALTSWHYQRYVKDYLRCIASVDESVGKVLDYLDESGLAENTIVIYASDQGFYLGEHGWFDKRWMFEESLRTPLLVRWPGNIKPGSVNGDIVSNLDFAETFLEAAGVVIPEDMQGRSLVPVLKGNTPNDWRKYFYYHYYEGVRGPHHVPIMYGVTDGHRKLIHYPESGEWEEIDLKEDPLEIGKGSNSGVLKTAPDESNLLYKKLKELQKKLEIPEPKKP